VEFHLADPLRYRFPTISAAVRGLACGRAPIDGEAVALIADGRSDFGALMTKRRGRRETGLFDGLQAA
jgi:ATP-dependent DNA ligase